jgi:hypothetical protein
MAENSVAPVARGDTFYKGGTADADGGIHLEGLVHVFPDTDPDDRLNRRSGGNVVCILVRNTHSAAVTPGQVVVWEAAYHGKRTDAPCGTLAERVAGVVDDHLPTAGAAVNDLYWLIVRGSADVVNDGGIAADSMLFASGTTAGRVILVASPSGTQGCRTIGTGIATVATTVKGTVHIDIHGGPA